MKTYNINEIFYSLQGEGVRAGTPNIFVRFSGCNLRCDGNVVGGVLQPVCDTEFSGGISMSAPELVEKCKKMGGDCGWVIFTGGEPALQLDDSLVGAFKSSLYSLAIETNGTQQLPGGIDWICVSPKTALHTIKVKLPHELKCVIRQGQALPDIRQYSAHHYVVSPAFGPEGLDMETLRWCVELVKNNPLWRLSLQTHKLMGIR